MNSSPGRQRGLAVRRKYRTFDGYNYDYKTNAPENLIEHSYFCLEMHWQILGAALPSQTDQFYFWKNLQDIMLVTP